MSTTIEPTAERGAESGIDDADLYEMLGNERRRHALRYLRTRSTPVSVGELAEHVAAAENGVPVDAVTPQQRKSAYTALYQNHLGKLADAGFVRAEREWVGIELTPSAAELEFGPGVSEGGRRPNRYSLLLSAAGLAVVASLLLGAVPSGTGVVGAVGLLFFLLLVLSADYRYRSV